MSAKQWWRLTPGNFRLWMDNDTVTLILASWHVGETMWRSLCLMASLRTGASVVYEESLDVPE